jgi:hypothetical protein
LLALIGLYGPAFAAIITVAMADGRPGVRALLRRLCVWRVALTQYLLAALLMPTLFVLAVWLRSGLHDIVSHARPLFLIAAFGWLLVITTGEELGWRGYALPSLQSLGWSSWWAGAALGVFWAIWHLPLYLDPAQGRSFPFAVFLFFMIGLSLIYTAIFNRSSGSILPAIVLHASTDELPRVFNVALFTPRTWVITTALVWLVALACILLNRSEAMRPTTR